MGVVHKVLNYIDNLHISCLMVSNRLVYEDLDIPKQNSEHWF